MFPRRIIRESKAAKRCIPAILAALLCLLTAWQFFPVPVVAQELNEFEVRAAFLFNFLGFIEWPLQQTTLSASELMIGSVGDSPLTEAFSQNFRDEKILRRTVVIKKLSDPTQVGNFQVIYFSKNPEIQNDPFFREARKYPVLTVGEGVEFLETGGIISFVSEKERIRFLVNQQAATKLGFKLSSKLLKLAKRVIN